MIAMADSLYSSARARYEEGGYMADRRLQSRRSARLPPVVADAGLLRSFLFPCVYMTLTNINYANMR